MRCVSIVHAFTIVFLCIFAHALRSEELLGQIGIENYAHKNVFYEVPNPLKIIVNPDTSFQDGRIKGQMMIKNPSESNKDAFYNTKYGSHAWQVSHQGKYIEKVPSDRSDIKPPSLKDEDFKRLKPGKSFTKDFDVDLKNLQMLDGTHEYQLSFKTHHVLPSVEKKIWNAHQKLAYNAGTNSNTVTFTYTKPSYYSYTNFLYREAFFYQGTLWRREEDIVRIKNPIRTRLSITSTPEEIQALHFVDLLLVYENPIDSGEVGYCNTRLTYRDIGLFSESIVGQKFPWHPQPLLYDSDFIQLKPGERRTEIWHIDLNERYMREGSHYYEIFIAGNHTLPGIFEKISNETNYEKLALTVDTKSNIVVFTYTKSPRKGKDAGSIPPPPATPDKLNDAGDPDSLIPPRLPHGTQVSSLRSCPVSGIYECPADAPGVTEHRLFFHKGRPMPNAFISQT